MNTFNVFLNKGFFLTKEKINLECSSIRRLTFSQHCERSGKFVSLFIIKYMTKLLCQILINIFWKDTTNIF